MKKPCVAGWPAVVWLWLATCLIACTDRHADREFTSKAILAQTAGDGGVPCAARGKAVVANSGGVIANSSSRVDSYRSSIGPYGSSNVGSNTVVQAATSITINGGIIAGSSAPNSAAGLQVVPVPSGAVNLPLGSSTPGSLNINNASESVTLAPGNYAVANLNLNFPGSISISPVGPVRIFVTGNLNLGGSANNNGTPGNLQFLVSSSGHVNVNSQGPLFGFVYAPTSVVNVNSAIFGGVVGSSVTLNSGAAVHFDQDSTCAPPQFPPQPPTALPRPPAAKGCYVRTRSGWQTTPCTAPGFVLANFGRPALPVALASNTFTEGGTTQQLPYVFAQFQASLPAVGTITDAFVDRMIPECPATGVDRPNRWSFQSNSNIFVGNTGVNSAVQFVLQSDGTRNAICVWNIDVDNQIYEDNCVMPAPPQRPGGFQPFDWGNVAGYVDEAAGTLSVVAALSWIDPTQPYQYAVVTDDDHGLAGNWFRFDGDLLGIGNCTEARFTDTTMVGRIAASSCPGNISASSPTCTPPNLEPHVSIQNDTATAETNNLLEFIAPTLAYANRDLAVANWTATTSGSCVDPNHVFVRDYDADVGGTPSNLNGQAFWMSPDIFLVPAGSPVDVNATASQSLLTPGGSFDIYVRVRNDFGCADVSGAQALIYIADPAALSAQWVPITNGQYLGDSAAPGGDSVPAGGAALIGPFNFTAPMDVGDGHKCLIAAIRADGEPEVANSFDAPSSNQVAQRNVTFGPCSYALTNATSSNGTVDIALTVVPAETNPSLSGGVDIRVTFDDPDLAWFNVWVAQPGNNVNYAVSNAGGLTTVRLGNAGITLAPVPLGAGQSRTATGLMALPMSTPVTTLELQATLRDLPGIPPFTNGGSCRAVGPGPVP